MSIEKEDLKGDLINYLETNQFQDITFDDKIMMFTHTYEGKKKTIPLKYIKDIIDLKPEKYSDSHIHSLFGWNIFKITSTHDILSFLKISKGLFMSPIQLINKEQYNKLINDGNHEYMKKYILIHQEETVVVEGKQKDREGGNYHWYQFLKKDESLIPEKIGLGFGLENAERNKYDDLHLTDKSHYFISKKKSFHYENEYDKLLVDDSDYDDLINFMKEILLKLRIQPNSPNNIDIVYTSRPSYLNDWLKKINNTPYDKDDYDEDKEYFTIKIKNNYKSQNIQKIQNDQDYKSTLFNEDTYFSTEEIKSIYAYNMGVMRTVEYFNHQQNKIIQKLRAFNTNKYYNLDINVDGSNFDKIFAIGDIHADYIRFYNLLLENDLIQGDKMTDKNKYEPSIITDVRWKHERTLLVICGDLVDGKRCNNLGHNCNEVNDPKGSFELLLFIFLFNLKYKANKKSSDVIYLFGNHDAMMLANKNTYTTIMDDNSQKDFYDNFMHETAKTFWKENKYNYYYQRKEILAEFYKVSPYILYNVHNKNGKKITFVHGGLVDHNIKYTFSYEEIEIYENYRKYYEKKNYQLINNIINNEITQEKRISLELFEYLLNNDTDMKKGAYWTRSVNIQNNCDGYTKDEKDTTFVVGHCPTTSGFVDENNGLKIIDQKGNFKNTHNNCDHASNNLRKIEESKRYNCIHPRCFTGDNPNVIMIDIALSQAMNSRPNGNLNLEILLIENDNDEFKFFYVRKGMKGDLTQYKNPTPETEFNLESILYNDSTLSHGGTLTHKKNNNKTRYKPHSYNTEKHKKKHRSVSKRKTVRYHRKRQHRNKSKKKHNKTN
jgi:hypothetical protein